MKTFIAKYSKAVAPVLNVLAQPAVLSTLHGTALIVVEAVLAAATALGVVRSPANKAA